MVVQKLDWYDIFTALLLKLAKLAKIRPKTWKKRIEKTGARGWLFDAAQKLEFLLYPPMRSDTPEACGKRLERAQAPKTAQSTKLAIKKIVFVDVTIPALTFKWMGVARGHPSVSASAVHTPATIRKAE